MPVADASQWVDVTPDCGEVVLQLGNDLLQRGLRRLFGGGLPLRLGRFHLGFVFRFGRFGLFLGHSV